MVGAVLIVVGVLGAAFIFVVSLVAVRTLGKEADNVVPDATRRILDRATRRLPENERDRFREEWPAGLEDDIKERPMWAFFEAVSLYRGAGRMARELQPAPARTGRVLPSLRAGGRSVSAGLGGFLAWVSRLWAKMAWVADSYRRAFTLVMARYPGGSVRFIRQVFMAVIGTLITVGTTFGWSSIRSLLGL